MRVFLPELDKTLEADKGENLLALLRRNSLAPEAPCGGSGICGKCRAEVNGETRLACQTAVTEDMTVHLSESTETRVLLAGESGALRTDPVQGGICAAVDIGTTTLAVYLMDASTGETLQSEGALNPQSPYGADVISRIRYALSGGAAELTDCIRQKTDDMLAALCARAGIAPARLGTVAVVGNPCMQQLFLGLSTENLVSVPYAPVLTKAAAESAATCFPHFPDAVLLTVPDIGAFLGADILSGVIAVGMDKKDTVTLLADIGTNGEMVLGNRKRMIACSAASGPALEGANIRFGMRAAAGAIDRVWLKDGELHCHVIGEGEARGICGSGLIDAAAAMLDAGVMTGRGRILTAAERPMFAAQLTETDGERIFRLTENVYLTQSDIRQLQLAKGAVAAGIELMAKALGLTWEDIDAVELAGAFGSFLRAESACRIALLPAPLLGRIRAVGNAAGAGARRIACDRAELARGERLAHEIESLELAALPEFPRCFARNMDFPEKRP